jgi:hypothetical protein
MTKMIEFLKLHVEIVWTVCGIAAVAAIWFLAKIIRDKLKEPDAGAYHSERAERTSRTQGSVVPIATSTSGNDKKLDAISANIRKCEDLMYRQTQDILKGIIAMSQDMDEFRREIKRLNNSISAGSPSVMSLAGPSGTSDRGAARREQPIIKDRVQEIVASYNKDPRWFKDSQPEAKIFGVSNSADFLKNPDFKPTFALASNGLYLYLVIDGTGYAVPNWKEVYKPASFKSGGMNTLFSCHNYQNGFQYKRLEVITPAKIRLEAEESVALVQPGELRLIDAEPET